MSKKHKKNQSSSQTSDSQAAAGMHGAEYTIIKHDLIKVVILNLIYLAGVLVLYFTDQKTHYLEHWFSKILHF